MFMTSAPSRLPASSKELWVRVEASKNRLIRVRPRRSSRFLATWRLTVDGLFGEIEQGDDLVARKAFDAKQMAMREGEFGALAVMVIKGDSIGRLCPGSASRAWLARESTRCAANGKIANSFAG